MQSEVRTSHSTAHRHTHPSTPLTRSTSPGKASIFAAPHSSRVVKQPNITKAPELSCSSPSSPPIVPARSPLRPRLRPKSTPQCPKETNNSRPHSTNNAMGPILAHTESDLLPSDVSLNDPYFSLSAINYSVCDSLADPTTMVLSASDILSPTSLAFRPDSPESMNGSEERFPSQGRRGSSSLRSVLVNSNSPSSSKPCLASQPTAMTKRQYALHELLSSERAYASDLALIKDIHLPLALGFTVPLSNMPATPPNSSGPSSRTQSTSSDSSASSLGPPMTQEDAKTIFGNITEIAMFTDMFTEEIETALGSVVEGGQGTDGVGALFLRRAPELERPYNYYITRHPTALQHLQDLPQTPALQNYLTYSQTVASSLSHAWDLSSLLIKPVQRLLKYPLLLTAIIDETPDDHPDKENLRAAREIIQEVARNVNEGRRRAEVVKDVLSSKSMKKPNTSVGVTASVGLSKMMSIRHGGVTAATMRVSQLEGSNNEAMKVEALQSELKRIELFAKDFAKTMVDWGKMTSNMMLALRTWSHSFGTVIGLAPGQGSEAFDAFLDVVEKGLLPLASDLEATINDRILKDLAHLLMTMSQPFKLIASMNEQEPYHYHLLTTPVNAKNRPPPSLLAASGNYLALRGQLVADLPTYISLLHKGLATLVRRLAEIQTMFWGDVRDRWGGLWEMLRAETELNVGREETCAVWLTRWEEVDQLVNVLTIAKPVQDVVIRYLKEKEDREKEYLAMVAQQNEMLREAKEKHERELALRERERQKDMEKLLRGQIGPPSPKLKGSGRSYQRVPSSSSQEPRHVGKAKAKKVTPVMIVDHPGDAFSSSIPVSRSPVLSNRAASSSTSTIVDKDGREKGKRSRAFSADAVSVLSGRLPTPPSSQDSIPSQKSIRGPFRRKADDSHLGHGPRSYASTEVFDDHCLRPSQSRTPVGTSQLSRHNLTRMQSMPLSVGGPDRRPISPISDDDDDGSEFYESCFNDRFSHSYHGPSQQPISPSALPTTSRDVRRANSTKQRDTGGSGHGKGVVTALKKDRSRSSARGETSSTRDMSPKSRTKETERDKEKESKDRPAQGRKRSGSVKSITDKEKESKDRPAQGRKRSGSVKSITSFFTGNNGNSSRSESPPPLTASQRDSWVSKPAKYICQVVHPCKPPATVSYYSFPFFTLLKGDFYDVLQEAGHPSIHPKLPLYVDDGEDCLLLCRDREGFVGWALASFLEPVSLSS